jgi:hypothetical protein
MYRERGIGRFGGRDILKEEKGRFGGSAGGREEMEGVPLVVVTEIETPGIYTRIRKTIMRILGQ